MRPQIEPLVTDAVASANARKVDRSIFAELYRQLLGRVPSIESHTRLIIVPDGRLHLLPFDALVYSPASGPPPAPSANPASEQAPTDFKPRTDVPLTPAAQDAVRVSEKWMAEPTSASPGPDGRVLFSYGTGLPTVVCAPLRVCMIELQPGEKLVGEPHIGDS